MGVSKNGWFISWKLPSIMDDICGHPHFRKAPNREPPRSSNLLIVVNSFTIGFRLPISLGWLLTLHMMTPSLMTKPIDSINKEIRNTYIDTQLHMHMKMHT